jgi:8-amino-7-oxononanoate synthase
MSQSLDPLLDGELRRRAEAQLLRGRRVVKPIDPVRVEIDGKVLVNFCSNDYLGIRFHPKLIAAMESSARAYGAGSGASGLICGYQPAHASAEKAIAAWKGAQAAVLLPSGYQANHAAIQTLSALGQEAKGGVRFLIDKLSHASLLDAARASGAQWRIFPHNGMDKLERLLGRANADQLQVVVTESIFSMDGDAANLADIMPLKQQFGFVLMLDEAHGTGVYGKGGSGLAAEMGFAEHVDVSVVTLSKAAGCQGGAICGSEKFCRAVLNLGRAYIYSTSLPSPNAAAIEAAIGVMREEPQRQSRLREMAKSVRRELDRARINIPAGDSPIIPIVVGDESTAMTMARKLEERNVLVQAIRPPTVPRGTSRLRVTLSSAHTDGQIAELLEGLTAQLTGG